VVSDFEERLSALVMEIPDFPASVEERAERVLEAMGALNRAGFRLVLIPAETVVQLKSPRRHRWRRERKEHV
jgi:hypothetical protein